MKGYIFLLYTLFLFHVVCREDSFERFKIYRSHIIPTLRSLFFSLDFNVVASFE